MLLDEISCCCPYCGETIDLIVDPSAGDQTYYEDCSVCCRPIRLSFRTSSEGQLEQLLVQRDDE